MVAPISYPHQDNYVVIITIQLDISLSPRFKLLILLIVGMIAFAILKIILKVNTSFHNIYHVSDRNKINQTLSLT